MTPEQMEQVEERDVVEFVDDEGNTLLLEVMDYFFYNGEEFAALCDAKDEDDESEEDGVYIMKINSYTDENGEEMEEFVPPEEALMEKLGDGLYLTSLQGLHAGANVQSGDFSLQADGFLVKDGKKAAPIKNFTVADNFFQLLKKVEDVSSEVKFGVGSDFGAPEVLLTGIAVSGK